MFYGSAVAQTNSLKGARDQSSPIHSKNGNSTMYYSSSNPTLCRIPTHRLGIVLRHTQLDTRAVGILLGNVRLLGAVLTLSMETHADTFPEF